MSDACITVQQAAKNWGISDRRVRVLCSDSKIPGAFKDGKSYKIPFGSIKPADGREKKASGKTAARFLKWENDVIGTIDSTNAVRFILPNFNEVVALYTHGAESWTPERFAEFCPSA